MESSSLIGHEGPAARGRTVALSDLGGVAAAFVRRMNEADLTNESVADVVAQDLAALLGGSVAVVLRDGTTDGAKLATIRQSYEHGPPVLRRSVDRGAFVTGEVAPDFVDLVLETGQSFFAPNGAPATDAAPEQQLLAVPVVARDETLGVIAASRGVDEPFSGDDLELLTRVADVTALAIRTVARPAREEDPASVPAAELSHAFESAADAIFIIDGTGQLLSSNLATKRMLGYSDRELIGRALHDIVADGSAVRRSSDLPDFDDPTIGDMGRFYEVELQRDDGVVIAVELTFGKIGGIDRDLYVAIGRDVSGRKRAEEHLRREASVDSLTGLMNRGSVHRALGRSIQRVEGGGQLALLFIDLDGFKVVNDTSGHPAGDEVLRAVAERLTDCVRYDDLVARYGGDEFIVLLEADHHIEDEVDGVFQRIERAFRQPFPVGRVHHHIGASIGCAIHNRDGTTLSQLLAYADAEMYRHKDSRRRSAAGS